MLLLPRAGEEAFFCAGDPMSARVILGADEMRRALVRMAHEIIEQNGGVEDLMLVGLRTRGVPLARRIRLAIQSFEQVEIPCGELDITLYRDDLDRGRMVT